MLNTSDINRTLKRVKGFRGVFPKSDLPVYLLPKPCSIVVNLDERWKTGSHWVAIYFPKRGPSFYFDSFGRPPPEEILAIIERNSKEGWTFNTIKIQGDLSTLCGYYCISFIQSLPDYRKFIEKFSHCSIENDLKFVNSLSSGN